MGKDIYYDEHDTGRWVRYSNSKAWVTVDKTDLEFGYTTFRYAPVPFEAGHESFPWALLAKTEQRESEFVFGRASSAVHALHIAVDVRGFLSQDYSIRVTHGLLVCMMVELPLNDPLQRLPWKYLFEEDGFPL
jgi:hypothetical protein